LSHSWLPWIPRWQARCSENLSSWSRNPTH